MLILDAGHGGDDSGAHANGLTEKDLNLEVTLYQYKRFKELGIPVLLTRDTDKTIEPSARAKMVKTSGVDICISNHFNAGGGSGSEVIHSIFSKGVLANMIADEFRAIKQPVRRVFQRESTKHPRSDYYYMHRLTGRVSTQIVEYDFLDNAGAINRINTKEKREKLAEAVVKAVCEYEGAKYTPPVKQNPVPEKFYRVQIGAYRDKEKAEEFANKMEAIGFHAYIKYE